MADLTITAASVVPGAGVTTIDRTSGATITAGKMVYIDASDLAQLADSNSATALARVPVGIALNGASAGQPVRIAKAGPVTLGAILTAGVAYYLSDTAGGICPVADVGAGEYPCIVGIATSTSVLNVKIQSAGVAI